MDNNPSLTKMFEATATLLFFFLSLSLWEDDGEFYPASLKTNNETSPKWLQYTPCSSLDLTHGPFMVKPVKSNLW